MNRKLAERQGEAGFGFIFITYEPLSSGYFEFLMAYRMVSHGARKIFLSEKSFCQLPRGRIFLANSAADLPSPRVAEERGIWMIGPENRQHGNKS